MAQRLCQGENVGFLRANNSQSPIAIFFSHSVSGLRCEIQGEIVVKSAATQRHGPVAAAAAASALSSQLVLCYFDFGFALLR
jgi:Myb/SANT-like DNA-binding domain